MQTDQLDIIKELTTILPTITSGNFHEEVPNLLSTLGYQSDIVLQGQTGDPNELIGDLRASKDKQGFLEEVQTAHLLFQITDSELGDVQPEIDSIEEVFLRSYMFFAVALKEKDYSRTRLSSMTRLLNKRFSMPVMVLFRHGAEDWQQLSIAVINRRRNKREEHKDVLGRVTLIHNINLLSPHRGHLEILNSFSFQQLEKRRTINNFDALHRAWEEVFDVELLKKKFYQEISDWYFWALTQVEFPDDVEKDRDIRNATSLIRLLTRLIFCWFLKEKGLIPPHLFDEDKLRDILVSMEPKESTFYYAILQNLFFATLNQNMSKDKKNNPSRKFVKDEDFQNNENEHGLYNLYHYGLLFRDGEEAALKEFADIPFLNGGLFECLDHKDENNKAQYVDGFSRNSRKRPRVPNELFFGEARTVDLSELYNDSKRKSQRVRGLVHILNNYKFTIVENTPVDQEIALDPELLGIVFENLLANYNPETRTTARKQTGSFYTPRLIVDYMVDLSLKAYLIASLVHEARMSVRSATTKLNLLFAYTEKKHTFAASEIKVLIGAIEKCNILDPACGSGAFPMGALHKLVFILQKLDPHNKQWKQRQIEIAEEITDIQARKNAILAIEETFKDDELGYGRKLHLIEHCLYGVDIQPIAIQIAKLRFFISLICDQKINHSGEHNRGIRPLPNLETKFVVADTLTRLPSPKGQTNIHQSTALKLEKDLANVRRQHFAATTREQKNELEDQDRACREQLVDELLRITNLGIDNYDQVSAENYTPMLASWDPYNATSVANFFDSKWMFNIDNFHIVIGNPPFIQLQKDIGKLANAYKDSKYETFIRSGDIYQLFYERGCELLSENGLLCYITSNKWMRTSYGKKLRRFFLKKNPRKLIDLGPDVFTATVDTNILLLENADNQNVLQAVTCDIADIREKAEKESVPLVKLTTDVWFIGSGAEISLKEKIERIGTPLKDWDISICRGILTGYNDAFIVDTETRERLIAEDPASADLLKPILRGRNIERYRAQWAGEWLIYAFSGINIEQYPAIKKHLNYRKEKLSLRTGGARRDKQGNLTVPYKWYELQVDYYKSGSYKQFMRDKIVWKRIGSILRFAYSDNKEVCLDSTCIATGEKLLYLMAFLNSPFAHYQLFNAAPKTGTGDLIVSVQAIKPLYSKVPDPDQEEAIADLVSKLTRTTAKPSSTTELEQEINRLIYRIHDLSEEEIAIVEAAK